MENEKCSKCNLGTMKPRNGRNGAFLACDKYPECKNTENVEKQSEKYPMPASKIDLTRQTSIVRQSSLKSAVEFWNGMDSKAKALWVGDSPILDIAETFEKWVNR